MRLSFLPVPGFIAVIAVLYSVIKPSLFYEPAWLLPITNTIFVTVVLFIVAYIAMRNYKATGRIQILLLGCGVLAFGIGGIVAGLVRSLPEAGANLNVTIYNTSALIGAIFHFIAAWILLAGISPEVGSKGKKFWLLFGYVGLTLFMSLFTLASLKGLIPLFFIQGVGPTVLRQWVLGSAGILFAFSFLIFMGFYLRNREVFLFWYSSALALTAISLSAFFIQSAVGSLIGWAGRCSQYLGGIYFLISVITAVRSAHARRISFDTVLTTALSSGEEKFRALAENSPDMISCFDRELKHIYMNHAGLRGYQKPADSIIGRTLEETGLAEPYGSLLKEKIQKVFETGHPVEVEHYLPTGRGVGFYQSHCVPEFGVDGTVVNVLVVSRDLTERKQMEEALRASEERYRALFTRMTEGFALHEIICDEAGKPVDYRFLDINPAFERLTGLKRETMVGKTVLETIPGIESIWIDKYGQVALTGKSAHFDHYSSALKRHCEVFAYSPAPRQFAVIFMDITERKRAEEELRRNRDELEDRVRERTAKLRESEQRLRRLSAELLNAQEKERKLVAREIHDSIGASLAATKFKVESALAQISADNPQTKELLESVLPIIQETVNEARRIQMNLRPSILDDLGILATIGWFCRQFESTYSAIRVRQEINIEEHEVSDSLKTVIFRVLQEAMNNIAKHSKASQVLLALRKTDQAIRLVIGDNGHGFMIGDTLSRQRSSRGLGLDSMRERTELAGGTFTIKSTDSGTIIQASWPL